MYATEILLTKDTYSALEWRNFILVLAKHIGGIRPFTFVVAFNENQIKFYIESSKDVSGLSSSLDGFLLRPSSEINDLKVPEHARKSGYLKVPNGGTVLDIRDQYKIKEAKDLQLIRLDIRRIADKLNSTLTGVLKQASTVEFTKQHLALFPAHFFAFSIPDAQNYIFSTIPNYVSLEKTLNLLQTDDTNAVFSVPGFPYSARDYYLPLSAYQFDKHSLIVGASGSGKSKLIQLIIDRIEKHGNSRDMYRIAVIDPHASLEDDLIDIHGSRIINLGDESAQLFPDANADISAATELTTTLFQSLLAEQYNPRLERVVRFSVYVLLTAQIMSLDNLKVFLTDLDMRMRVLEHVQGYVPQNIQQFFGSDFNELRSQYYGEAILPIVSLVDEMQLQPSLVGEADKSLAKTINDNFLTVFSLNKVSMGEKAVKTVAGLLIQQIFLIAQARILPYRLILIIDEVSVVQNPALASILAEARKFNLSVILTQQYFSQVESSIRDSILGNIVNYYVFRVSEEDAIQLEGNMVIEIPKEIIESERTKGLDESKVKINFLTSQSVRECFVRVSANGQLMPAIKAVTMDISSTKDSETANRAQLQPKLHKLPQKMILTENNDRNVSNLAVLKSDEITTRDISKDINKELQTIDTSVLPPKFINIQHILADQSSSRDNAKKEL